MTRYLIAIVAVLAMTGCVQSQARYGDLEFSTSRLFKDDSIESATLEVQPETGAAKLEIKGKRSDTSAALDAAMGTLGGVAKMLMDENSKLNERVATEPKADERASLFDDEDTDAEPEGDQ